jgi:hypothetical protein
MSNPNDGNDPQGADHAGRFSLGEPVFLEGEDPAQYYRIREAVTKAVAPRDAIEELLVADVVALSWEALRLRRLKEHLLKASAWRGLPEILGPLLREPGDNDPLKSAVASTLVDALSKDWYANDPRARSEVDALLKKAGLTMDAVMAQTAALRLDEFERISEMLAKTEKRRNAALRELDRYRKGLGNQLRVALAESEDGKAGEGPDLRNAAE